MFPHCSLPPSRVEDQLATEMELSSEDDADSDLKDNKIDLNDDQEDEAALRAALHFHVGEICSGETTGKAMTSAAVSTLSEVRVPERMKFRNVQAHSARHLGSHHETT